MLKDDVETSQAAKVITDEVAHYKAKLEKSRTKYSITEESVQPDGSVIIKIKKQVSNYSCGDYLA
jgi:hypothetical protein